MNEPRYRFWGQQPPKKTRTSILDLAQTGSVNGDTATLRIYEPIDSWGEYWGVSAIEFTDALNSLPANIRNIDLRINSPGGEVFEAIAILNALRAHPATVTATVDGIAASAASFLAAGADQTVMGRNAQMMIHDASGVVVGRAADMTQMADVLNKLSDNIASIYADKSGTGGVEGWRAAMLAESWYTAQEAVDAGLADCVAEIPEPQNTFDLSMYAYQGREKAPGPVAPIPVPQGTRFTEQAASVLADVKALADRAAEVMALRAEKGKDLAPEVREQLRSLGDELNRLTGEQVTSDYCPEYLDWMARRLPEMES